MLIYELWNNLACIIALWWWFCPCPVGGAVWNHTAWLFPLMPLPTLSLFYSYFLSGNKYRKNIPCKNIGQFQFCINLLPLELIRRSASCPRHWNQRWFGDAAFTISSGKQWDHMSPWAPSWLSAGIDECCRSANESGHQRLKKQLARNDLILDQWNEQWCNIFNYQQWCDCQNAEKNTVFIHGRGNILVANDA